MVFLRSLASIPGRVLKILVTSWLHKSKCVTTRTVSRGRLYIWLLWNSVFCSIADDKYQREFLLRSTFAASRPKIKLRDKGWVRYSDGVEQPNKLIAWWVNGSKAYCGCALKGKLNSRKYFWEYEVRVHVCYAREDWKKNKMINLSSPPRIERHVTYRQDALWNSWQHGACPLFRTVLVWLVLARFQ